MATGRTEERRAFTLLWKIENISWYDEDPYSSYSLKSPRYKPRTFERLFYLELSSHIYIKKYLTLTINLIDDPLDKVHLDPLGPIDCELSFIGSNGSPLFSETVLNHDFQVSKSIKRKDFVSFQELFETRTSAFLPHDILTVLCRIWKSEGEFSNAEFVSLRTRFEREDVSFPWTISGFNYLKPYLDFTNPIITTFSNGTSEFQLKCSINSLSLKNVDGTLTLASVSIHDCLNATLKVSVLDKENKTIKFVEKRGEYVKDDPLYDDDPIHFSEFLSSKELLMKNQNFFNNDVIKLFLEVSVWLRFPIQSIVREYYGPLNLSKNPWECTSTFSVPSSQTVEQSRNLPDNSFQAGDSLVILREDLLSLYKDQSMSDFELLSDDVSFPVHKIILSARSPVFRTMFSSNMEDSGSKSLNVPDLESETLNRLLIFLYGGTVDPLEWENGLKLYYAADKYQVHSLKIECCSFFRSNISVRNVCDIVTLADKHQDLDLKSFTHSFVLNHYDETMSSPEWAKFLSEGQLAGLTMHQVYLEKLKAKKK